ncbi:MAG: hypothetical protein ACLSVD_05635 [Eggerthellaceae bacterium]
MLVYGIWDAEQAGRRLQHVRHVEERRTRRRRPRPRFRRVERTIADVSPIERSWQESFTMVNLGGESRSFVGLTDTSLVTGMSEGRAPLYDNEVLVGSNLASLVGLELGDEFMVPGNDGVERPFIVCGKLSSAQRGVQLRGRSTACTTGGDRPQRLERPPYALADPGRRRRSPPSNGVSARRRAAERAVLRHRRHGGAHPEPVRHHGLRHGARCVPSCSWPCR